MGVLGLLDIFDTPGEPVKLLAVTRSSQVLRFYSHKRENHKDESRNALAYQRRE